MDELHRISQILIEHETIDKDQFERLLAGDTEEAVFAAEEAKARARAPEPEPERRPRQAAPLPASGRGDAAARARRRQLAPLGDNAA